MCAPAPCLDSYEGTAVSCWPVNCWCDGRQSVQALGKAGRRSLCAWIVRCKEDSSTGPFQGIMDTILRHSSLGSWGLVMFGKVNCLWPFSQLKPEFTVSRCAIL